MAQTVLNLYGAVGAYMLVNDHFEFYDAINLCDCCKFTTKLYAKLAVFCNDCLEKAKLKVTELSKAE